MRGVRQAGAASLALLPDRIERRILVIRDHKVMLDSDLAELYRVSTKRLNEQVKRNRERFPEDFMFQLTVEEVEALRSQIATTNEGRGGRRYRPCLHGARGGDAVKITDCDFKLGRRSQIATTDNGRGWRRCRRS